MEEQNMSVHRHSSLREKSHGLRRHVLPIVALVVLMIAGSVIYAFQLSNKPSRATRMFQPVDSSKTITLNMIGHWKGEDKRQNFVTETLQQFEIENPTIKVNLKWNMDFPGGRDGALKAVSDQIKAGTTDWDIIWMEPFNYQPVADVLGDQAWGQKYLVDFEQVAGFTESQKSFIISDPQYRDHMNGMLTGPYIEGFYQPMFYNKEVADMMGLTIKEKDMTYADFLGYVKAVDTYNKAHGTAIAALYESENQPGGGAGGTSTWNLFQNLFRSKLDTLEEVKSLDPSPKKYAAIRSVFDSLQELSQYSPLIKSHAQNDWFTTRGMILDNTALFTDAGASWMYSHWAGIDSSKVMKMYPVEMPAYKQVPVYMGGYNPMFAVMKNSPHKEEAIKLLMAFSTSKSAELWSRYAKAPSGIKGNVSQAGQGTDQYDKFITYISDKYGGNIYDSKTVDYVLGKKYVSLTDSFALTITDIIDGKITAAAAYDQIIHQTQAIQ